jgi:hypothetical protein
MIDLTFYLIAIMAIFGLSGLVSITKKGFSLGIFECSLVISMGILIWQHIFPFYIIVFNVLIIAAILFSDGPTASEINE